MINRYKKFFVLFIFVSVYAYLSAQARFTKDPLYSEYITAPNMTIRTFVIVSMTKDTSKTRMYLDKQRRLHFAYFDKSLGQPIYVKAHNTNMTKYIIDDKIGHGDKIVLSIYEKTFSPYMAYMDTKGLLWYAHNDSGKFESYNIAISSNAIAKDINIVVSVFSEPVLFVVDKNKMLYVSRFVVRNRDFITDFIYTNKKIESIYPVSDNKGYKLFLEDSDTHNIIFGYRSTNTKFRFLEEYPLAKNVSSYSVYYEADRRFSLFYTTRDNDNTIYEERFYNERFETLEYLKTDKKIIKIDVSKEIDFTTSLAYLTDDNLLNLYVNENIYNLYELGKVSTDFKLTKITENLYALLHYSLLFKELRLSIISLK